MIYDIIIVGAGMSGLSCALGLINMNFSVAIIDKKNITSQFTNYQSRLRFSAINDRSKNFLKQLGVWDNIIKNYKNINDYVEMKIFDHNVSNYLNFKAYDFCRSNLGMIINNNVILSELKKKLFKTNISVFEKVKIKKINICYPYIKYNNMTLSNGTHIKFNLLIGADGSQSFIRKYFKFKYKNNDNKKYAIIANVKTEKPHNNTAYQKFFHDGVLAFLPLFNPNVSSIVYSIHSNKKFNKIINMTTIELNNHLFMISKNILGKIFFEDNNVIGFPFDEFHIDSYYTNSVILIADAAHSVHPLAGQGINIGFYEIEILMQELRSAILQHHDLSDMSILRKYDRKIRLKNTFMINSINFLRDCFCNDYKSLRIMREFAITKINQSYILKKILFKIASGK